MILKNKKGLLIAFTLLSLGCVIAIIFLVKDNKTESEVNNSPSPNPTFSITSTGASSIPFTYNPNEAYFLNQIVTNLTPVTGYSWKNDSLLYSTSGGIYEGGTNNLLIQQPISKIFWNSSFNAVLNSNGKWFIFDFATKSLKEIGSRFTSPKISNTGDRILDFSQKNLFVLDTANNKTNNAPFSENITGAFFVDSTKEIVVSTLKDNVTSIHKLDGNLKETQILNTQNNYVLSSASPDGNSFVITLGNETLVSSFSSTILKHKFSEKSKISTKYRGSNEIIAIEKYVDSLGRTLDNIYILSTNNNIFKISDSRAIVGRINTGVEMAFNTNATVLSFAENKGRIWILALKPNLIPTYSTSGELVFSIISPKGF